MIANERQELIDVLIGAMLKVLEQRHMDDAVAQHRMRLVRDFD